MSVFRLPASFEIGCPCHPLRAATVEVLPLLLLFAADESTLYTCILLLAEAGQSTATRLLNISAATFVNSKSPTLATMDYERSAAVVFLHAWNTAIPIANFGAK